MLKVRNAILLALVASLTAAHVAAAGPPSPRKVAGPDQHYKRAVKLYKNDKPEQALAAVRRGLAYEEVQVLSSLFDDNHVPSLDYTQFTGLIKHQVAYAETLAASGQREEALEVLTLSGEIIEQAFSGVTAWNSDLLAVIANWLWLSCKEEKILRALGETEWADAVKCRASAMDEFWKRRLYPATHVLLPLYESLMPQLRDFHEQEDLTEQERKKRLLDITKVWRDATNRFNRSWVLKWKVKLMTLDCPPDKG